MEGRQWTVAMLCEAYRLQRKAEFGVSRVQHHHGRRGNPSRLLSEDPRATVALPAELAPGKASEHDTPGGAATCLGARAGPRGPSLLEPLQAPSQLWATPTPTTVSPRGRHGTVKAFSCLPCTLPPPASGRKREQKAQDAFPTECSEAPQFEAYVGFCMRGCPEKYQAGV